MSETSNAIQRPPNMGNVKVPSKASRPSKEAGTSPRVSPQVDRVGDRLLQLPEMSEVSTLTEATLRWLRHRGEGPPMFKLGRRLVCWERDLHAWIAAEAAKDPAATS